MSQPTRLPHDPWPFDGDDGREALPGQPMQWRTEALWRELSPILPGLSVEVVERTASTNTALLDRSRSLQAQITESGAPPGDTVRVRRSLESAAFGRRSVDLQPCLLVAEHQTGGRGRQGRPWQATPGASLTFSLAVPLSPRDWSGLSLAVGVALADALDPLAPATAIAPASAPRIALKWPNDLWLLDAPEASPPGRKLGGVLIETVSGSDRRLAVIGVGLNVRSLQASEARTGVACLEEIDPEATVPGVLAAVAAPLARALQSFERDGFAAFADRYAARDLLLNRPVLTTSPQAREGMAVGVAADGALRVRTSRGVQVVSSGEVSVRLDTPDADLPG